MPYILGLIVEISKYIILVLLGSYLLFAFLMTVLSSGKMMQLLGFFQCILIYAFLAVSFIHLTIAGKNEKYLFLYFFSQLLLFAMPGLTHLIYEKENLLLQNNMCMLLAIGFCMIARLSYPRAVRQLVIVSVSFMIAVLLPGLIRKLHIWKKLTWVYAVLGVGILSSVLLLGEVYGGSKISFTIADSITFQPSEFVKLLFLFFLAGALWESCSFLTVFLTAIIAGIHVIILVLSNDLGSALLFFVTYVFVVFAATRNFLYLLIGLIGGAGASVTAYQLFSHVRIRVLSWQDPWTYIDKEGYQITQSLFAIGSGNWFGMGLYRGNPKAIPLVDRDFIFSSICEEMGVLAGIIVILICMSTFWMIMQLSLKVRDRFYQMILFGGGILYLSQIILTIGGGIKFIPMTGVTLPLVSYGGSSAMTTIFLFYIIQGIAILQDEKGGQRLVRKGSEILTEGAGADSDHAEKKEQKNE